MKIRSAVSAQRDPMNKKGPPHDQKHVVTKHDDFPITFSIRFYNSLYYRTSRDVRERRAVSAQVVSFLLIASSGQLRQKV